MSYALSIAFWKKDVEKIRIFCVFRKNRAQYIENVVRPMTKNKKTKMSYQKMLVSGVWSMGFVWKLRFIVGRMKKRKIFWKNRSKEREEEGLFWKNAKKSVARLFAGATSGSSTEWGANGTGSIRRSVFVIAFPTDKRTEFSILLASFFQALRRDDISRSFRWGMQSLRVDPRPTNACYRCCVVKRVESVSWEKKWWLEVKTPSKCKKTVKNGCFVQNARA